MSLNDVGEVRSRIAKVEHEEPEWFDAYEEIRHAHAVGAFLHPEEIFVTTMPKTKEFTEEESLLR